MVRQKSRWGGFGLEGTEVDPKGWISFRLEGAAYSPKSGPLNPLTAVGWAPYRP